MRKISLENYSVDVNGQLTPYDVPGTLITCLLHPSLQLAGRELLARNQIGTKIESADGFILLEDAEYAKLESAFETVTGFSRNDVELVDRVLNAETVEVSERTEGV